MFCRKTDIFQMFSNRLGIAEVVIVLNQTIKQFFMFGSSNLSYLDWLEFFYSGMNWCCVYVRFTNGSRRLASAGKWFFPGRQFYQSIPVKLKHKSPANTILEYAIGLSPVPVTAYHYRQSIAAFLWIVGNKSGEVLYVPPGNNPLAICE